MGRLVAIKPDGTTEERASKKLDLAIVRELIGNGCTIVERVRGRYEGRVRDIWLDEEGLLKVNVTFNPYVREMAEAYYGRPCQEFAGTGVVWVPGGDK